MNTILNTNKLKRVFILIGVIALASVIFVLAQDGNDYAYLYEYDRDYYDYDYIGSTPDYYEYDQDAYSHEDDDVYDHHAPIYYHQDDYDSYMYDDTEHYLYHMNTRHFREFTEEAQTNDCHHAPYPCFCHVEYLPPYETDFEPFGGYIGITPFSEVILAQVTSPAELATRISQVAAGTGNIYVIPIAFPGNTATSTVQNEIHISGNRHIVLDSVNSENQVWNRDQTSSRHISVSSGATIEIRNVTLTRSADWRANLGNANSVSGGIMASGEGHIIFRNNATVSHNHGGTSFSNGGGGVNVQTGSTFTMFSGNIINNTSGFHGGGVMLDSLGMPVTMTIWGGTISGNSVTGHGGGIGMCCGVTINMHGGHIYNNTAGTHGGGIGLGRFGGNHLQMEGGVIGHTNPSLGNVAPMSGGGVHTAPDSQWGNSFTMNDGNIFHNTANGTGFGQGGGGVFVGVGGPFDFNGGVIGGRWDGGNLVPAPNTANRGGGIFVTPTERLQITGTSDNAVVMSNNALQYGGGVYVHGGILGLPNFIMTGGTIGGSTASCGNTAGIRGGGVYVGEGARFLMQSGTVNQNGTNIQTSGTIIGNSADFGGGVYVTGIGSYMTMSDGLIYDNIANEGGGGVFVSANTRLYMQAGTNGAGDTTSGSITNNEAAYGGGINLEGTLRMYAGHITNNEAINSNIASGGLGGGIYMGNTNAFFTVQGSEAKNITNNTARYGGGVHYSLGFWEFENGTNLNITSNNAAVDGAGVWLGTGRFMTLDGGIAIYNNTAIGSGGGIYAQSGSQVVLDNPAATIGHTSPINGNTAAKGGGISLSGNLFFREGNIIGNAATGTILAETGLGGGVYLAHANAQLIFDEHEDKNIHGNTARVGGGLHWGQGLVHINPGTTGITLSSNTATSDGGGMWFSSTVPRMFGNLIEIYGNNAVNGAGIMVDGSSPLTLTGAVHIFDNTATGAGGGIMVAAGSHLFLNSSNINIGHTTSALGNTAARGGGVSIDGTLTWINGNIFNNRAIGTTVTTGLGGGIHFGHPDASLVMQGTSAKNISGNTARNGGGVHWSQGTWNVSGQTGNINIANNHVTSRGGGLYMSNGRTLTMNNRWTISDNSATGWGLSDGGGGVWLDNIGTVLTINGGFITENDAFCAGNINSGGFGGGVHVFGGALLDLISGEITNNHADAIGGGIMAQSATAPAGVVFTMSGGTINNNTADNGGGGLSLGVSFSNDSYATMTGGDITENRASHGGGVWLMHGILTMYDGKINENYAGIGVGSHPSNRHGGGGGVMVCCTSRLYMHDGEINDNTGRVGGGVYISHAASMMPGILSYFTMYGGEVDGNTAILGRFQDSNNNYYGPADLEFDGDGGGIFITSTGFLKFEGSDHKSISYNTAENSGGGVRWVTGYWDTADNTSVVDFIGNTAAEDGGGIYIGGGMFITIAGSTTFVPGSLTTYGTWNINDNEATRGGGVFVGGGYFLDDNNEPEHFSSTFVLTYGGLVANNDASLDGGGIFLYDGVNFNMTHNTTVRNNTAGRNGGGVFMSAYADFTMTGGLIGGGRSFITNPDASSATTISPFANSAQRGGGVYMSSGATFVMEQGTALISGVPTATTGSIRGNRAFQGGGGVAVIDDNDDDVLFILRAGAIEGNITPGVGVGTQPSRVSGGGVLVAGENARFEMEGGLIDDNANPAWSGAGVTVMGEASMYMTGGTISNNTARTSGGGGVAVRHDAVFTMDGGTISGNHSIIGGGVLSYNQGRFIMENGNITANIIRGTGIPVASPGGNLGGGGVAIIASAYGEMHGGTISDHILRNNLDDGGGVWVGEVLAAVNGGAHFEGVSVFTMTGGYIIDNFARRGGGVFGYGSVGIAATPPPLLEASQTTPHDGYVPEGGYIGEAPHTVIENEWIQHLIESAAMRNPASGIMPLSNERSRFIKEGGYIENNEAHTNGGGIHAANGFLVFLEDDALVIDNTANHDGGGIWIGEIDTAFSNPGTSILTMNDGTITENTANRRGGGIFIGDAEAIINGGEISENTATNVGGAYVTGPGPWYGSGGGIYVSEDGTLSTEEVEIIGNHAAQMGGGIFTEIHQYAVPILSDVNAYSNLTIDETTHFEDNTAGQGAFTPPANAYTWTGIPGIAQGIAELSIHSHPINNYDINWRRGTVVPLSLHKANQGVIGNTSFTVIADITPYLLEGAYFTLFRFIGTGTPPATAYAGSTVWEVVQSGARSTGNLATPIILNITPEGIYQLVETQAPVGYQLPFGQWRIVRNAAIPGGFAITPQGASHIPMPIFLDGHFHLGNWPGFDLPITGGRGASPFIYSGAAVIVFAMVIMVYFHANRKKMAFSKNESH